MPSFLPYLSYAGDQVVTIPNGSYTGGTASAVSTAPNIVHPATNGPYKGFLVLKAQTPGGVTVIPENTAVDTLSTLNVLGAQRILFIGIDFGSTDGIVSHFMGCQSVYWWYCSFAYAGSDHPAYPGGANYAWSPSAMLAQNNSGQNGIDYRWYGCDIGPCEDDGFRCQLLVNPIWQGCHWQNIYHSESNFNYHSDCIQVMGGITNAQILDGHMDTQGGTGFMCGLEASPGTSISVTMERMWIHGAYSYGTQYFRRPEAQPGSTINAVRRDVYSWNCISPGSTTPTAVGGPGYTIIDFGVTGSITVTSINSFTNVVPGGTDPATAWRAVAGHGYNDWASFLNFAGGPPPPPQVPGAPTSVEAVALSPTQIQVSWTVGTGTIDTTIVEYGTGGQFTQSVTVAGTTTVVPISVGLPDTTYSVRVRHQNAVGYGVYSGTVTVHTPAQPEPPPPQQSVQPQVVGSGPTGFSFNAATLTLTSRADVVEDDVLLAVIAGHAPEQFPLTLPSGWALVPGTATYEPGAAFGACVVFKAAVDPDDIGTTSYVFTHDANYAGNLSHGRILVIRGSDPADPFDQVTVTQYAAPAASVVAPTMTTTVDYTLYLLAVASDNGTAPVTVTSAGPAGLTGLWDLAAVGSAYACNSLWQVSGGLAGVKAAQTAILSEAQEAVVVAIAVQPAAAWSLPPLAARIPLGLFGDTQIGATIALLS